MPITVDVNATTRRVTITGSGRVDDADLLGAFDAVRAHPGFSDGCCQLIDMVAVEDLAITSQSLRLLAARRPVHSGVRRAVVAPADLPFGMARVFEAYADGRDGAFAVFRTTAEAEAWLGDTC